MTDKITELREKREKIVQDQRKILDNADSEKRSLNIEEEAQYNNMDKEFDILTNEINQIVKIADSERAGELRKKKLAERESELRASQGRQTDLDLDSKDKNKDKKDKRNFAEYTIEKRYQPLIQEYRKITNGHLSSDTYLNAYKRYLIGGMDELTVSERNMIVSAMSEVRALQTDNSKTGGFLVAPEQMVMQIIEALDNIVFVRKYATIIPVPNAQSLGAPARDTDIGDPTWTAEIRTGDEDSSMDFDRRQLTPHPLARMIKASNKLIRVSLIDIVSYIAKRLAYKHGIVQENAFLNGDGNNKPLGVFTASAQGINTDRDVSAGNTATAIGVDGLINAQYALKQQYRGLSSNRWCFHRDALKMIRKLKDGNGQYLWTQGLLNAPDTILGVPFDESEYAPNTFTTGLYVGILGDWSNYWIAESLSMEIQVAAERYIETYQTGYFSRTEVDGMPVLSEAFVRVKLA